MRDAAVRKTTAPEMRNDPQLFPQLILGMEWYSAPGTPPRNYYKFVAAFTFLNRISTVYVIFSSCVI